MNGDVTVRDVMTREFVGASEGDGVVETVALMLEEGTDTAIVLRGTEPVGVLGERDVLQLLVDGDDPASTTVGEVMATEPVQVPPDHPVEAAADRLSGRTARPLVVWDGEIEGIVTARDLLAAATIEPAPAAAAEVATTTGATESYSTQSICEACGSLTRDLVDVSGQLLCPDCRDV